VRRGCPRQEAASQKLASRSLVPISSDPLDDLAEHIDGAFVVVVAAAERAARSAQAAGHNATVFLAELKPLWRLAGYR
jgi:hypothetical protein